jgi:lactate dehydrogenase-like 2-hydroxyacid dehydrogenase
MSPIAMKTRPRVFALDPLDPEVEKYARTFFDLTLVGQPGFEHWREEADALMVRSATITAGDVARFSPGLRFISKHGVGLDRIDLVALRKRRVAVMNTPGVNVSLF